MNVLDFFRSRPKQLSIAVLSLLALAAGGGAYLIRDLKTEYSIRQFMDPKNPLLISEFKVKDDFALPQWPAVYVNLSLDSSDSGTFLEPDRIARLKAANEEAAKIPGVTNIVDISSVEGASSTKEGLTIGKVLDLTPPENWADRVFHDPLLTPNFISKDGRTALITVLLTDFDTKILNPLPDQLKVIFGKQFPKAKAYVGGIPAIQSQMATLLRSELRNFLGLALIACLITLASFFRDRASIVVPIFLVALANIGALSGMVLAKFPFTVLSTTLPVLVSIIVLSIVTHTMIVFAGDWHQASRLGEPDKLTVLIKTMKSLFLPNFLTSLTTSLGFVALLTTGVPLIHEYAACVASGVIIAWLCVMIALPPVLYLIPIPKPREWTSRKARWALKIKTYNKQIVFFVVILAMFLAWKGKNLNWSTRLFDDLPADQEARIASEYIDKNLGAVTPLDVIIRAKDKSKTDIWNEPVRIAKLDKLMGTIRDIPGVGSAIGLSDFIKAGSRAQNLPLPDKRTGIAEIIFIYSLSPDRVTSQYLTPDGTETRISARIRDVPAAEMQAAVDRIKNETQKAFPEFEVEETGMAFNLHTINRELCESLIFGFWQAIALISLVLIFIFRSVRWTLVAMLPNLISPISLMGVMAITATPIKPGIALIFSIALGIAYNNTVYLLSRVRLLYQQKLARGDHADFGGEEMPVSKAWYQEGNPCVFSTLALVGGFVVFMASYFELNRLFGAYMLLSIVAGMLGDLIFLPALLTWFPEILAPRGKKLSKSVPEPIKNSLEPEVDPT